MIEEVGKASNENESKLFDARYAISNLQGISQLYAHGSSLNIIYRCSSIGERGTNADRNKVAQPYDASFSLPKSMAEDASRACDWWPHVQYVTREILRPSNSSAAPHQASEALLFERTMILY